MAGLKLNKDNVEKVKIKNRMRASRQVLVIGVCVAIFAVGIVSNIITSQAHRDIVQVVVLKSSLPKDGLITEANLASKNMVRAEYENYTAQKLADGRQLRNIVAWNDRSQILGTYAQYYLRYDTPIYWDSLTKTSPRKHSYLYNMDGEFLKIEGIDPGQFGEIVVPGDKVNIRVSYLEDNFKLPTEEDYTLMRETGLSLETSVTVSEKLFTEVTVIDILNKDGGSIFDVYYALLELPKAEQKKRTETKEFQDQVKPNSMFLVVTPEEVDRYANIIGKSPSYLVTLLPREGSNMILDALAELQVGFARS